MTYKSSESGEKKWTVRKWMDSNLMYKDGFCGGDESTKTSRKRHGNFTNYLDFLNAMRKTFSSYDLSFYACVPSAYEVLIVSA